MALAGNFTRAGMLLRKRRKELGMKQGDLARAASTSSRTLGDMERGKPADYQEVSAVMDAVGWTAQSWVDMLAGRDPTPAIVGLGDYVGEPVDSDIRNTGMTAESEILEKLDEMHKDIAAMNERLGVVERRLDERP